MALFARDLLTLPVDNMDASGLSTLREALLEIPKFEVDNVYQYVREQTERMKSDRFPPGVMMPPFADLWIEYRAPLEGTIQRDIQCFGSFVQARVKGSGWMIRADLLAGNRNVGRAVLLGAAFCELDPAGRPITPDMDLQIYRVGNIPADQVQIVTHSGLTPIFLSLMFLHCKNVARIEHAPPPAQAKRALERGNPPLLKYHTIEIEPMKAVLRREGRIETEGLERALHICRGHFAHYTQNGPGLFGRGIHGDFWIPAHVRGTEKKGVVISDYSVNAPEETTQ